MSKIDHVDCIQVTGSMWVVKRGDVRLGYVEPAFTGNDKWVAYPRGPARRGVLSTKQKAIDSVVRRCKV